MSDFSNRLLTWFDDHGRHDLPWQIDKTPYRVWVSEIMLQQTQVQTVIPYYNRFMERFPRLDDLAGAPLDDVLALWSGLGYYSRARNLHAAAIRCATENAGALPDDFENLVALPGIGRSTAGAILAIAFEKPYAILDGNVKRVLARFHALPGWPGEKRVSDRLWELAEMHTPVERVADYTQAIMDLGATLCVRSNPDCKSCVQYPHCLAAQAGTQHEHPGRRPKRTTPTRDCWMLMARNDEGAIGLERRPPSGIWGGLWCLPQFDSREALEQFVSIYAAQDSYRLPSGETFRHGFTHFKLNIHPVMWTAGPSRMVKDRDYHWVTADELDSLGLPQPVRRFLDRHFAGKLSWQDRLDV